MSYFIKEYPMHLSDIDASFYAKKTSVLAYFQECFAEWCLVHHVTGRDLNEKGLMWVIGNMNIEFLQILPTWNENLKLKIWVSEVKKLRVFLDFKAYLNDKLVAKGDSCFFVLEQKTRKPVPIKEIIEPFGVENECVFDLHKREIITFSDEEKLKSIQMMASYSDLDYNGHVNNISYLTWCLDSIPAEYKSKSKVKKCHISFEQECFFKENITLDIFANNNCLKFNILKNDDNSTAAQVKIETELL